MLNRRIACWMSDKKLQKIKWNEFEKACKQHGYTLFKLDLSKKLEDQGNIDVFLHKLTDIIASADQGDERCITLIRNVENFIEARASLVVLDPIPNVRQLLNRYTAYRKITLTNLNNFGIFIPNFCELNSKNTSEIVKQLKNCNVTFPLICKAVLGHGSREAHKMSIIFNEGGLRDCKIPCVAQSFINHNAILYKIYVIGEKCLMVERPSLKNFRKFEDEDTIHFDSGDISKAGAISSLTILDPHEPKDANMQQPDPEKFEKIARTLRKTFGMDLLGIDVVIEKGSEKYAIVDINVFPGYDEFPDFYNTLVECIDAKFSNR